MAKLNLELNKKEFLLIQIVDKEDIVAENIIKNFSILE